MTIHNEAPIPVFSEFLRLLLSAVAVESAPAYPITLHVSGALVQGMLIPTERYFADDHAIPFPNPETAAAYQAMRERLAMMNTKATNAPPDLLVIQNATISFPPSFAANITSRFWFCRVDEVTGFCIGTVDAGIGGPVAMLQAR